MLPNVRLILSPFSRVGLFSDRGVMVRALCHSGIFAKSRNCGGGLFFSESLGLE
jgi:hypothetical protein